MKRREILVTLLAAVSLGYVTLTHGVSADAILRETGVKGGLVVHVGIDDGSLTTALRKSDAYIVFGLDRDIALVGSARETLQDQGLYGAITVDQWIGDALPLIDNVVNLLVLDDCTVPADEIQRVLVPGGVAWVAGETTVKPVPPETDEWTHYLHEPDNNAVSRDKVVSYPYHMQWAGNPVFTRNHNHMNGYSAVVSAGGRVFAILDDGPIQSVQYPPKWQLVARDAYNGIVLWRKPIAKWEPHLRKFRSGPVEITRRLVAAKDRVFVTLGYGEPVSVLDAATGDCVRELEGTEGAEEILHADGVLYLVIRTDESQGIGGKQLMAVSAETGQALWQLVGAATQELLASTLCMDDERLFFQSPGSMVCLARDTGKVVWKTSRPIELKRKAWSAPTVTVVDGVVLCADGKFGSEGSTKGKKKAQKATSAARDADSGQISWTVSSTPNSSEGGELIAFDAKDGQELWRCPAAFGYCAPPNVFVANGLVWVSSQPGINFADMTEGRDLRTGEVKQTLDTAFAFEAAHHHRCYRDKATEDFLLLGRTGVEFVNLKNNDIQRHFWIRGTCQYGLMPANGLLYLPGHSCGCYIQSKLNGFWALAPKRQQAVTTTAPRLTKGPAYGKPAGNMPGKGGWPMHRRDHARSGATKAAVPPALEQKWSATLGGELTPPVIAAGKVIVAGKASHVVTALRAVDGAPAWSFTAGGGIDSPPSVSEGFVVFGSHDGYVYCLRLGDGEMVWRFRAAPADRRTMAFGQVESVWPVVGSVSIIDGTVYCVAGRSSYIDDGMALARLDLVTGKTIGTTSLYSRNEKTGEQPDALLEDVELPGSLPDILVCQDDTLFLRDRPFDLDGNEKVGQYEPHLYCSAGLLDPTWWHRTTWIWGPRAWGRASGWSLAGKYNPSGRLLVLGDAKVYGYKFKEHAHDEKAHTLFCAAKDVEKVDRVLKNNNAAVVKYVTPDKVITHWSAPMDFAVRGMVKAGDKIFAAGPKGEQVSFDGTAESSLLSVFSTTNGKCLSTLALPAQPVFDGMAAAREHLFMSLVDGQVVCYGGAD